MCKAVEATSDLSLSDHHRPIASVPSCSYSTIYRNASPDQPFTQSLNQSKLKQNYLTILLA